MKLVSNPPNPFESTSREWLEPPPRVELQLFEDETKDILSRNDSPDLPFRWSVNPYRGCFHACAYCYARSSHEYLGFGAGTDFESKIVVKRRAAALLRQAFDKPSWKGELIVFSGNTDCYQPTEASLGLTRACLEVCAEYRNPVGVITKSALPVRDVDVLSRLHREAWVRVYFSIPFTDNRTARLVEPQAPTITKRFEAMQALAEAGIPTGISIAPVIPGLNDEAIPELLARAKAAGAVTATWILLRLPGHVEEVFLERMRQQFPDRIGKIIHRLREVRGGPISDAAFFRRHEGTGTYWQTLEQLFEVAYRRAGFQPDQEDKVPDTFRRPEAQQFLFPTEEQP
jgi:DNA repair photolyase